ncbi:MAG: hemerythrin domain-containing protein [Pseudohongiella sp.]|nr:hemerythrin domain-containing protein [Pseudohongiella sp.]MDO9521178.1 hemerythrin domain-containing protein [Pseudohongiella sp.]MDP2127366.1 hemerythrin domain-containing protein [Pseudohongiella sp.]
MKKENGAEDAIKILKSDHKKVKDAFKEYEQLGEKAFSSKKKLADKICAELTIHTQVEEEIFYPLFRQKLPKEKPLVNEAAVEHASAKELISQIQSMSGDDPLFDAKVKVLSEYINHHVREEEKEMFPLMRNADVDLNEVGSLIMERKQQLQSA